ncbi:hypothetical protein F444_20000 [Phytophthora nicotianae P1976]|uniref:Uncharacterized protein n=2 Tax=Phytophthora nicotianae TaxID=4792 RepID=A0A080Z5Z5_PHYNI|nr:hypothetical protein F444_20000 [Phytophthora nicotianae P1976]
MASLLNDRQFEQEQTEGRSLQTYRFPMPKQGGDHERPVETCHKPTQRVAVADVMCETSYRSLQLDLMPDIEVSWLAQSTLRMLAQVPHQCPQVNQVVEPKLPNLANASVLHLVYLELLRVELRLVSEMRSRSHHRSASEVLPTITATDWLPRREPELVDVVELWPTLLSASSKINRQASAAEKLLLIQLDTLKEKAHIDRHDVDKLNDKLGRLKKQVRPPG